MKPLFDRYLQYEHSDEMRDSMSTPCMRFNSNGAMLKSCLGGRSAAPRSTLDSCGVVKPALQLHAQDLPFGASHHAEMLGIS